MSDTTTAPLPKNIFLLWLQGWDNCTWLNRQVADSWEYNNPDWKIHYLDENNIKEYVPDIDYIFDATKQISPQAKSDIIRLGVLKHHGGVWADATMLCMQPLDHWVHEAVEPAAFWVYHGYPDGAGPASWFIISKPDTYIINHWKAAADSYWWSHDSTDNYSWMDGLFFQLRDTDPIFGELWSKVPNLYCELDGQSHTLAWHLMHHHTPHIQDLFLTQPPYALKLWKAWTEMFPDEAALQSDHCQQSNGYCAIRLSKRRFVYKHTMT